MEYINAEEFLKQDEKVQKVFLDWWNPNVGDLFYWNTEKDNDMREVQCCRSTLEVGITLKNKGIGYGKRISLLTESQLRQFIEDKTDGNIDTEYCTNGYIVRVANKEPFKYVFYKQTKQQDLLQAYWKVAIEVAKENIKEGE